jgi:hypothetical protein
MQWEGTAAGPGLITIHPAATANVRTCRESRCPTLRLRRIMVMMTGMAVIFRHPAGAVRLEVAPQLVLHQVGFAPVKRGRSKCSITRSATSPGVRSVLLIRR